MKKRLQIPLDEAEIGEIRRLARLRNLTVAEWVHEAIRSARRQRPAKDIGTKLAAVRKASKFGFPTADIDTMLAEIRPISE